MLNMTHRVFKIYVLTKEKQQFLYKTIYGVDVDNTIELKVQSIVNDLKTKLYYRHAYYTEILG